jgi:uncharacterized membrane protein YphA (DoxX/SURF4 family)
MKLLRTTFRILIGVVFIFSGFVKGIDPLGTVYRMDDYFAVFNLPWMSAISLWLTIFLCVVEFTVGVSLLFNLWIKKTAWVLLLMMMYFTILTFFDAVYNLVPDCGCFGDALKMTNLQTFLKNLVLMALVVPVFIWRKQFKSIFHERTEFLLVFLTALSFTILSVYCYRHLPLIDFMAWKEGNNVKPKENQPVIFYVKYKNKLTGEEKEYVAPNYPWNDSVWLSQWIFQSQRVVDPNGDQSLMLRVEDEYGGDFTPVVYDNVDFQFILVAYDLTTTHVKAIHRILPFYKNAIADGFTFFGLTSMSFPDIKKFRLNNGVAIDFYQADDVVLKTMVRSNPGLILMKNGMVIRKWAFRDFPSYDEVKNTYLKR